MIDIILPKSAFMKYDKSQNACWVFLNPWNYSGIGAKNGEEVWTLGAQFLQNYLSIYDFKNLKVGLVESITSDFN